MDITSASTIPYPLAQLLFPTALVAAHAAPPVGTTGTLYCSLQKLEKGATYTVTLTVKVNAAAGTTLSNTATTVSNMQDFVQSNNKGTLTTKVL